MTSPARTAMCLLSGGLLVVACSRRSEPSHVPASAVPAEVVQNEPLLTPRKEPLPPRPGIDEDTRARATAALTRKMREVAALSDEHSFRVESIGRNCPDGWKIRFEHLYRTIVVMDSQVEVCFTDDGRLEIVTDRIHREVVVDTKPGLTSEQAFAARRRRGPQRRQTGPSELFIWSVYVDPPPPSEEELRRGPVEQKLEIRHRLVYRFESGISDGVADYLEFVDAHSGEDVATNSSWTD